MPTPEMIFTYSRTRFEVRDESGAVVNYSAVGTDYESCQAWATNQYGLCQCFEITEQRPYPEMTQVIKRAIAAGDIDPADETAVNLMVTRMLNMARDAGRPSDAARSTVSHYKSIGRDEFLRRAAIKPSGSYREDA